MQQQEDQQSLYHGNREATGGVYRYHLFTLMHTLEYWTFPFQSIIIDLNSIFIKLQKLLL